MSHENDPARQAVETLAWAAGSPEPPVGLRLESRSGMRWSLNLALAAGGLVLAGIAGWWIENLVSVPQTSLSRHVVVERLRVGGKRVEPKVLEVPGAQAVVLMVDRQKDSASATSGPVRAPAASLVSAAITHGAPR